MDSEKILPHAKTSLLIRAFSNYNAFIVNLDWEIKLLLALPLALIFFNDSWLFTNILGRWVDPWIYLGHFIDLKQHLITFAKTYYGTRLPWILPGYLVYQLFPALIANYILHLVFYYSSTISLFLILKHTIDRRTALFTTILMSSYFFFMRSLGSNYIDGAGITYFLLTLLMLTLKENSRSPQLRLMMAGVFYGCLVYTQLFLITFTPLLITYYCFTNRHNLNKSYYFVYGFFAVTFIFCVINYFLNGIFLFFMPIVDWSSDFVSSGVNPWWTPISTWWMRAWWLVFPAIVLLGSFLFILLRSSRTFYGYQRSSIVFQACLIMNILLYVVLDLFAKQPVLSYDSYSSYLIPAMFLALGSQLSTTISSLSKIQFYILLAAVILIPFLPYVCSIQSISPFYLLLLASTLGIIGLFVIHRYAHMIGIVVIFISLSAINLSAILLQVYPSERHDSAFHKLSYLSLIKSARFILSMDPESKALFWYDRHEPSGYLFRSIASLNLWAYRLISEGFPSISGKNSYNIPAINNRIFLISNNENAIEQANKSLFSLGLTGEIISEKTIEHGNSTYKITFVQISKLEESLCHK